MAGGTPLQVNTIGVCFASPWYEAYASPSPAER